MCHGPKGWGTNQEKMGPEGWVGAQNFALFVHLPPLSFFLSLYLGVFLVEFWWCLKRRGRQMCTFWSSRVGVKPRRPRSRRGGIFEDVQFYPMLHFGHFWAPLFSRCFLPHNDFWPFLGLPSPLTFHNVNNHGGSENCQGTKNKRKQRKQHKTNRKKTTKKDTGGTNKKVRVFLVKTRLMPVQVFRCLGV